VHERGPAAEARPTGRDQDLIDVEALRLAEGRDE